MSPTIARLDDCACPGASGAASTGHSRGGPGRPRRTSSTTAAPRGARSCAYGMAVQQHHRLPLAAVPHAEHHVADIHAFQTEAIEHEPHLPTRSRTNRGAVGGGADPFCRRDGTAATCRARSATNQSGSAVSAAITQRAHNYLSGTALAATSRTGSPRRTAARCALSASVLATVCNEVGRGLGIRDVPHGLDEWWPLPGDRGACSMRSLGRRQKRVFTPSAGNA